MSRELACIALNILMRLHKEFGRVVSTGPLAYFNCTGGKTYAKNANAYGKVRKLSPLACPDCSELIKLASTLLPTLDCSGHCKRLTLNLTKLSREATNSKV